MTPCQWVGPSGHERCQHGGQLRPLCQRLLHVTWVQRRVFQSKIVKLAVRWTVLEPVGNRQAEIEAGTQTELCDHKPLIGLQQLPALTELIALNKNIVALGQAVICGKINVTGGARDRDIGLPVECGSGQRAPGLLCGIDHSDLSDKLGETRRHQPPLARAAQSIKP